MFPCVRALCACFWLRLKGHLRDRAKAVIRAIEAVVAAGNSLDTTTVDPDGLVPEKFWLLNEVSE